MQSKAETPNAYIEELTEERKVPMAKLRATIQTNLDPNFKECMLYGMLGYVVPHDIYPEGYHCNPKLPLPFMNLASQKNFIAVYHMGMYAKKEVLDWFVAEYPKHSIQKLDMGKSCIRFKKMNDIPYELIGQLAKKMTMNEWVKLYEVKFKS